MKKIIHVSGNLVFQHVGDVGRIQIDFSEDSSFYQVTTYGHDKKVRRQFLMATAGGTYFDPDPITGESIETKVTKQVLTKDGFVNAHNADREEGTV